MKKEDAFIRTFSGGKVYFFEPERSNISIEDIIHPLSMLCRFNGNSTFFYSVSQHSVLVADKVYEETKDRELGYSALLHDGVESFISDIPSPFKQFFPEFKEVELRMERWLSERFGFQFPFDPIIKKHDLKALSTEMRDLMNICDNQDLPEPYNGVITPLNPQKSKELFVSALSFYSPV